MAKDMEMGLLDHLDELRGRILIALVGVVVIAVVAYVFKEWILAFLTAPIATFYQLNVDQVPALRDNFIEFLKQSGNFTSNELDTWKIVMERMLRQLTSLTFLHPTEAFISYIKLSLYTGFLVGAPLVLLQLWRFILPALYENERRYFFGAFTVGSALFYLGVIFAFQLVFPLVIGFLINLGSDTLYASLSIGNYISFSMMFLLVFGLVFELPVLIFLAVRTGLTTVEFLRQKRRYLYVFAFIGAALITPPDVVSQLAIGVPIIVLFEASLILSTFAERRREKAAQASLEAAGLDESTDSSDDDAKSDES